MITRRPPRPGRGVSRLVRVVAVLAAATALAGCGGSPAARVCTGVGVPAGVGLDVEPPLAARVTDAAVEVCWDGHCRRPELRLAPSSTPAPLSCSPSAGPSGVCGASASPTGGKHGFGGVAELPTEQVRVTVVLRDDTGGRVVDASTTATPETVLADPDCRDGHGRPQLTLTVDDGGLHVDS